MPFFVGFASFSGVAAPFGKDTRESIEEFKEFFDVKFNFVLKKKSM